MSPSEGTLRVLHARTRETHLLDGTIVALLVLSESAHAADPVAAGIHAPWSSDELTTRREKELLIYAKMPIGDPCIPILT